MELRRALLLFAVVLGLAAIATSFSRPEREDRGTADSTPVQRGTPAANPRPLDRPAAAISFSATGGPATERLATGRAAVVTVEVLRPGQVELEGLGLTAPAQPLTPARFDLLETRPGSYPVRFAPAAGGEPRTVGELEVVR